MTDKTIPSPAPPPGDPKAEDPPDIEALKLALRHQLVAILSKPLGMRMLAELETVARLSRDMLMARKDPRARGRHRHSYGVYGGSIVSSNQYTSNEDIGDEMMESGAAQMYPNPGMRAETFGATVIRELIASLKEFKTPKPTLTELMMSLRTAKDEGMTELVKKIEGEIDEVLGVVSKPNGELGEAEQSRVMDALRGVVRPELEENLEENAP